MNKVTIIGEAGVNHNGSLELAINLIDAAVNAGCDYVKFQTFRGSNVVSRFAKKAAYQKQTTDGNETQLEMIKKLELSEFMHIKLIEYCNKKNIQFLSTPFDLDSIDLLKKLNISVWKIPSGEIINLPYLIKIAKIDKPIILSTGMSTLDEIKTAVNLLKRNGAREITLLHCNTEYPTPYEDVNLRAMLTIKNALGVKVGYSDHTPGIEVPIAAVAMGATVIEKHFTLDKNMEGPDHKASLEPDELAAMVQAIRNIEKALGTGEKVPSPSEKKNIIVVRKSIVAKCAIKKGETFTENNITVKRPGNGISPMKWFDLLGKAAVKDFIEDELIVI
ncbi:N-acetylneuraminate synthase [Spirochaetia bacterium]|nr:N-acetylneuraminate synthase [Spirochaetia bacterium]